MIDETSDQNVQMSQSHQNEVEGNAYDDLRDYLLARDRARRVTTYLARCAKADFIAFALNIIELVEDDPRHYKEAQNSDHWKSWH